MRSVLAASFLAAMPLSSCGDPNLSVWDCRGVRLTDQGPEVVAEELRIGPTEWCSAGAGCEDNRFAWRPIHSRAGQVLVLDHATGPRHTSVRQFDPSEGLLTVIVTVGGFAPQATYQACVLKSGPPRIPTS